MIKAVLFDYGGVLVTGGRHGAMHTLFGELLGLDQTDLQFDDLHRNLRRGIITEDDFFAELARRHPGRPVIDAQTFVQSFGRLGLTRVESIYRLAETLRGQAIVTGILSNIYAISARWLRARGDYDGFDPVILSCEEKSAKPEPAIYQAALDRLNLPADQILFIDDQEKCMPPARQLGLHTILAESPEQIMRETKALLRKENDLQF